MQQSTIASAALAAALMSMVAAPAHAAVVVSEASAFDSGNSSYQADWFELTNTGSSAVDITGWKMDDDSDSAASAVALHGVTSIGAGQSVVFIEDTNASSGDAALDAQFASVWFGTKVPSGLTIGNYGGKGVGLSSSGDAVNIFDPSGTAIVGVTFGASTTGYTFDNAAGLSGAISKTSMIGSNGAF